MNAYKWLYGPYLYDYHLYYPTYQCVITDILTAISVNVWPYQCMSGNQSMYVCTKYKVIFFLSFFLSFFLFITQIIIIVFFSGQINNLYDV